MQVGLRQCSVPTMQPVLVPLVEKVSMTTRVTGISLVKIVASYLGDVHILFGLIQ